MELSEKSRAILEAIAKGHTYEQILVQDLAWTYHDIFQAAAEALAIAKAIPPPGKPAPASGNGAEGKAYKVEEIRQAHRHAYEKWSASDDEQLRQLFHAGKSVNEVADAFQRQPGAIRSRLAKLGLVERK